MYIGNSVHYKQTKISFRTNAVRRNPEEKWLKIEGTHEPIIGIDLWEAAHKNRNTKQRLSKDGTTHIFSGLVKCADCGRTMSLKTTVKNGRKKKSFDCSTYKKYGPSRCSGHYLSYNDLYELVLNRLRFWVNSSESDKEALCKMIVEKTENVKSSEIKQTENKLKSAKKKLADTEKKMIKLFEDREKGVISEKTYCMMMKNYENEQTSLETDIVKSEEVLAKTKQIEANVGSWLAIVCKYTEITELNAEILNEFIEKILIHKPEKDENGNRTQKIDICYRFIGKID